MIWNWICAHFFGDFFLQNDCQAANKKKSSLVCLYHVLDYMLPFLFVGSVVSLNGIHVHFLDIEPWRLGLIAIQHFIQDRTNFVVWLMKVKGSANFVNPPCGPWSVILTDNLIHIFWIYLVLGL